MSVLNPAPVIQWQAPPADLILPDDPVDHLDQPLLAAALTESLELAGYLQPEMLVATNFGLCAWVDGDCVVKAPDWLFVPSANPLPPGSTRRSYTPHLEGAVPAIVMEFLSATEGGEYSIKSKYPPGKWFFYEQVLQVPIYAIFDPAAGWVEVFQRSETGYQLMAADANGRYWLPSLGLSLGLWQGRKATRSGWWLRWWDAEGELLLWGAERLQQQERLAAKLRELGINPTEL